MKDTLEPGLSETVAQVVDRERTIDFMGEKARVYATPMLVRDIEVNAGQFSLIDPLPPLVANMKTQSRLISGADGGYDIGYPGPDPASAPAACR